MDTRRDSGPAGWADQASAFRQETHDAGVDLGGALYQHEVADALDQFGLGTGSKKFAYARGKKRMCHSANFMVFSVKDLAGASPPWSKSSGSATSRTRT